MIGCVKYVSGKGGMCVWLYVAVPVVFVFAVVLGAVAVDLLLLLLFCCSCFCRCLLDWLLKHSRTEYCKHYRLPADRLQHEEVENRDPSLSISCTLLGIDSDKSDAQN